MTHQCRHCGRTFLTTRGLQTHTGMLHGGVPECPKGHARPLAEGPQRPRGCRHPGCRPDRASVNAMSRRNSARNRDPRNLVHPCWWCHRHFATEMGMRLHMGKVHERAGVAT